MKYLAGYLVHLWGTTVHKFWVALFILRFCCRLGNQARDQFVRQTIEQLAKRALTHDLSKYRWSEAHYFALTIFDLWQTTYGSPEYQAELRRIKPAIDLHYQRNRHHPEHFAGGFYKMDVIDVVEMVADWCASVRRHKDGDIHRSITLNQTRFGYSDRFALSLRSMAEIMLNTEKEATHANCPE